MNARQPAFYARPGSLRGDLIALLHPPYTAWHLSYVAVGAALAPTFDWIRLEGALAAFFLATGGERMHWTNGMAAPWARL